MPFMRRVIFIFALFLTAFSVSTARATEVGSSRRFGLGFQVGDPTAIVGKYFLSNENAIDFGFGYWGLGHCSDRGKRSFSCDGYHRLSVHGDFLWQYNIVRGGSAGLDWHIGPGARIYFGNDRYDDRTWLEARMPLGLDLTFQKPSFLEVFFEIVPGFFITPFTDFDISAAIGVRFYF